MFLPRTYLLNNIIRIILQAIEFFNCCVYAENRCQRTDRRTSASALRRRLWADGRAQLFTGQGSRSQRKLRSSPAIPCLVKVVFNRNPLQDVKSS